MKKILLRETLILLFCVSGLIYAQNNSNGEDSIEVIVIDSYITPEIPHKFMLSFFTSENCKSKVLIENKYEFPVSDTMTENHKTQIDVSKMKFTGKTIPFVIIVEDSTGRKSRSDNYDVELPFEPKVEGDANFLLLCLFGGAVFALPSPAVIFSDGSSFALTKEIPVISLRGSSFNYPVGYFSVEYSHVFKPFDKNLFRVGYKHLIEIPVIRYISPGINYTTNFKGFNAVSPEISIGWFRILNAFTVYTRGRLDIVPGSNSKTISEFSIGLYSSFFSLYL